MNDTLWEGDSSCIWCREEVINDFDHDFCEPLEADTMSPVARERRTGQEIYTQLQDVLPVLPPPPLSPPPSLQPPSIVWTVTGGLTGRLDRDGYRFLVVIQAMPLRGWYVLGLVTPLSHADEMDTILKNHTHQNLGACEDLMDAQMLADRFLRSAPLPHQACACAPLFPKDP